MFNEEANLIVNIDNPMIEEKVQIKYINIENCVKRYWSIKLYVHVDREGDCTFKVKLTSQRAIKLPDGRTLKQSVYVDECDFEDKGKVIRKELRKKGSVDDNIYRGILDYVNYLKDSEQYTFLEDVSKIAFGADKFKSFEQSGVECYEGLIQEIKEAPLAFKVSYSTDIFKVGDYDGVLEEDYNGTGFAAIVIEGENLKSILGIEGKNEFENVIRAWRDSGVLLSGDRRLNRMTTRYTFCSKRRKPAYAIKIEKNLCGFVFNYPHYKNYEEFVKS
jgi:hypothetical protein